MYHLLERNNVRIFKYYLCSLFLCQIHLLVDVNLLLICFDSFQNLGFVVMLRSSFFFFSPLHWSRWVYFSVPGSFFTQGSSLTLLALLYAFLVIFSSLCSCICAFPLSFFAVRVSFLLLLFFAECLLVALSCARTLLTILFLLFRFILLLSFLCCELRS